MLQLLHLVNINTRLYGLQCVRQEHSKTSMRIIEAAVKRAKLTCPRFLRRQGYRGRMELLTWW